MNQIPKAVFSRQGTAILEAAHLVQEKAGALQPGAESWAQAYVAGGDLVEEVTKLKEQDGKPMFAYGGSTSTALDRDGRRWRPDAMRVEGVLSDVRERLH